MQRASRSASIFGLASIVALGLATTQCWGEPFTLGPTTTAGVSGSTVSAAGVTNTTAGIGGASSVSTTAGATGTEGGAGESGKIPSPYGENCQEVRKPADADLFLYGMYPDDNQDYRALGDDRLEVSQYGSASKRTLLLFRVVPESAPGYTVAAAFLELQLLQARDYGGILNLHRLLERGWEERVANWNIFTTAQPWTTPGGDFEPDAFASLGVDPPLVGQKVVWDVTTEVQRMHGGGANYGWMLKEAGEPLGGAGLTYVFAGRDTVQPTEEGPILSIHFCN